MPQKRTLRPTTWRNLPKFSAVSDEEEIPELLHTLLACLGRIPRPPWTVTWGERMHCGEWWNQEWAACALTSDQWVLRANYGSELTIRIYEVGLPWWLRQWRICPQCGRSGFDPSVMKMPWSKGIATSSILVWRIPWTEEPGRLQFMGLQRVGHDWATHTYNEVTFGGTKVFCLDCGGDHITVHTCQNSLNCIYKIGELVNWAYELIYKQK